MKFFRVESIRTSRNRSLAGERGFSLIELMIAMLLGLIVGAGLISLILTSSRVNAVQLALSRLQESGRIAIDMIAADLRLAGRMPCGSHVAPQIFSEALAAHITGAPLNAAPSAAAIEGQPYDLDRGVFLAGSQCTGSKCVPLLTKALGVPQPGLATGDRVPGTDVLTVRYLSGDGTPANVTAEGGGCAAESPVAIIESGTASAPSFVGGHLALLATCTRAQVLAVTGSALRPVAGTRGTLKCQDVGPAPRLFDFDSQMQTSTYYLQLVQDETAATRKIATLMRRTNGVVNEVVQGVERMNLRYSLRDREGNAYWLEADEVDRGVAPTGDALACGADASNHRCSWSDIDSVDIALLVNTIDDLPSESSASAWAYRYSVDDDDLHEPAAIMPVTGLASGRMLRREFRTVVALRNLAP